jgi:Protein of unknown function (DUF1700)
MLQPKDPAQKIELYLKQVRSGLRNLPEPQVADVLQELRSHILERAQSGGTLSDTATDAALQSLGRPQEVASLYVAENFMARAESSRTPWTVLRGIFHWATLSLKGFVVLTICLTGYGFGAAFFIAALAKPFNPHAVGLWMTGENSLSLRLGMTDSPAHGHELLGWLLIPLGCSLGGGTILLTTHFGLWCIRRFQRARSRMLYGT